MVAQCLRVPDTFVPYDMAPSKLNIPRKQKYDSTYAQSIAVHRANHDATPMLADAAIFDVLALLFHRCKAGSEWFQVCSSGLLISSSV